jgi:hypothetical protein
MEKLSWEWWVILKSRNQALFWTTIFGVHGVLVKA